MRPCLLVKGLQAAENLAGEGAAEVAEENQHEPAGFGRLCERFAACQMEGCGGFPNIGGGFAIHPATVILAVSHACMLKTLRQDARNA
jgi:hypothetical protein